MTNLCNLPRNLSQGGNRQREKESERDREKIDQPLVFLISHYFSPPEEKTERKTERVASRLLTGWPELKSRRTTTTTIAAAAAALATSAEKTKLFSYLLQHRAAPRWRTSHRFIRVSKLIPAAEQNPLDWILSQNDPVNRRRRFPRLRQDANTKSVSFHHCCWVATAQQYIGTLN